MSETANAPVHAGDGALGGLQQQRVGLLVASLHAPIHAGCERAVASFFGSVGLRDVQLGHAALRAKFMSSTSKPISPFPQRHGFAVRCPSSPAKPIGD